ncbi:arylsulfatase [Brachybacterium sp. YJGR34]|uniref:arylsulfatase n=1 Tax=Brachybacterium sp. YJGR34 TaxID=2059911 RepID=UPI000E0A866D|nr:arylsulfatase [Brachybacterium sp. YJGR34]
MTQGTRPSRPDIVILLADDMGFSDIGCYGGEMRTPVLDALGRDGTRCTQFYNSPRCSPTRASLLTGLHPHQVGVGILTGDERPDGYAGDLSEQCHTIAELLRDTGYGTYLAGKWHLSASMTTPTGSWPLERGFERAYGTIDGAGSYFTPATLHREGEDAAAETAADDFYYTDAIGEAGAEYVTEHARQRPDDPLFLYVPFTAPHWPLHAPEADIERCRGRYDEGWDATRRRRYENLRREGIIDPRWDLSDRDDSVPAWEDAAEHGWQSRRMEVYAAQVEAMDRAIGRIVEELERTGRLENTLLLFLSDNGACEEEMPPGGDERFRNEPIVPNATRDGREIQLGNNPAIEPGGEDTYTSYGREWANVSAAPFREYKHWVHEGGISTPLIAHWPAGLGRPGDLCRVPAQLVDIVPTLLEASGAEYPAQREEHAVPPPEGTSLLPLLRGESTEHGPLLWEHEGNRAVRSGRWKLVRKHAHPWELYDLEADRTELHDLAAENPDLVAALAAVSEQWARRVGVIDRDRILRAQARRAQEDCAPEGAPLPR